MLAIQCHDQFTFSRRNLRVRLYNATSGEFVDGLGITHASMHATLFPAMAGAVDEVAAPGMGLAVVNALKAKGMRCSCMAGFWLLEGLYKVGWHTAEAADHVRQLLLQHRAFHSFPPSFPPCFPGGGGGLMYGSSALPPHTNSERRRYNGVLPTAAL